MSINRQSPIANRQSANPPIRQLAIANPPIGNRQSKIR
jgi:hypothetical protein